VSRYFAGVDGGGSYTRAVILDAFGTELGRAQGGPAIADAARPDDAANSVMRVVRAAATSAGVGLPLTALVAGLSGAGREAARSSVELELELMGLAARSRVDTDVSVAFHDAFGDGPGVLLIAGTGSIAWGRAEDGREGRVGGWGHHIGDEGSGYAIGLDALRRVAKHADGRAPETNLLKAILAHVGTEGLEGLVPWTSSARKADIAALAPVVARAAAEGDVVAREILADAVDELEGHVLTILTSLGPWEHPPQIVLAGGLLMPGRPLREPVETALAKHDLKPQDRVLDGALGAARLAMVPSTSKWA
jgi:glucosamine kinase